MGPEIVAIMKEMSAMLSTSMDRLCPTDVNEGMINIKQTLPDAEILEHWVIKK